METARRMTPALVLLSILALSGPLAAGSPARRALPESVPAPGAELATGHLQVEAEGRRILVTLDRFEAGQPADGRIDRVFSFDAGEPVEPFFFDGLGLVRVRPDGLTVTLPGRGDVFDLVLAGAEPALPAPGSVSGQLVRHGAGRELYTYTPAPDEAMTASTALERVRRRRAVSTVDRLLEQDPGHGDDGGCASSCSMASHAGGECSVSCPFGQCARCTLAPLECKCVDAK